MNILAFSTAREQAGFSEMEVDVAPAETPREILRRVAPALDAEGMRAAVDCEYWGWDTAVGGGREMAIIPPVSGG